MKTITSIILVFTILSFTIGCNSNPASESLGLESSEAKEEREREEKEEKCKPLQYLYYGYDCGTVSTGPYSSYPATTCTGKENMFLIYLACFNQ